MERQGELSATQSAVDEATGIAQSVTDPLREQLNTSRAYGDGTSAANEGEETSGEPDLEITDRGFVVQNTTVGSEVVVEASVTNRGSTTGEMDVKLMASGTVFSKTVIVAGDETKTAQLRYSRDSPGSLRLSVNGQEIGDGQFTRENQGDSESNDERNSDVDSSNDESSTESPPAQTDDEGFVAGLPMGALLFGGGIGVALIGGILTVIATAAAVASWRSDEVYDEEKINWAFVIGYSSLIGGLAVGGFGSDGVALFIIAILLSVGAVIAIGLQFAWIGAKYTPKFFKK